MVKLGEVIFIIAENEIYEKKVYAITAGETFLTEDYNLLKDNCREISFQDYGKKWFFTLQRAKEMLLDKFPNSKLLRGGADWWYLE